MRVCRLAAVVATALMLFAGCGDDSSSSADGSSGSASTADSDEVATGESTDAPAAEGDTVADADPAGDDDTADDADTAGEGETTADADTAGDGDTADSAMFEGDLTQAECDILWDLFHAVGGAQLPPGQLREMLDSLPDRAPGDIEGDLRALADAWRPALQMLEDLGVENMEDAASLSEADRQRVEDAAAAVNSPELSDATSSINAFVAGGC
jgi:hypothetical protein